MRGEVIEPGDSGYDEARALYNAMIDKRPALIVRCRGRRRRDRRGELRPRQGPRNRDSRRRAQRGRPGIVDDGLVLDMSTMSNVRVDPGRTDRGVGGAAARRRRPRHPRVRPRRSRRDHLDHRRGGTDAGGRDGSPDPRPRAHDRQPALGRPRPRGRQLRPGERGRERGPVLGDQRRRAATSAS